MCRGKIDGTTSVSLQTFLVSFMILSVSYRMRSLTIDHALKIFKCNSPFQQRMHWRRSLVPGNWTSLTCTSSLSYHTEKSASRDTQSNFWSVPTRSSPPVLVGLCSNTSHGSTTSDSLVMASRLSGFTERNLFLPKLLLWAAAWFLVGWLSINPRLLWKWFFYSFG